MAQCTSGLSSSASVGVIDVLFEIRLILGLFSDVFSTAWVTKRRMVGWFTKWKGCKISGRGLFYCITPAFVWRDLEISVRIASLQAEIRSWNLLNTTQGSKHSCWTCSKSVWCSFKLLRNKLGHSGSLNLDSSIQFKFIYIQVTCNLQICSSHGDCIQWSLLGRSA
jgi:hypothetical protein